MATLGETSRQLTETSGASKLALAAIKQTEDLSALKAFAIQRAVIQKSLRDFWTPVIEMQRAREEMIRATIAPILEIQRAQRDAVQAAIAPVLEMQRARDDALRAAIHTATAPLIEFQKATRQAAESFSNLMKPFLESRNNIAQAIAEIARFQSEAKTAFANIAISRDLTTELHRFAELAETLPPTIDGTIETSADEIAQSANPQDQARQVRAALFALCDSEEFLPERSIVSRELEKIGDFEELGIAQKIDLLLRIGRENRDLSRENQKLIRDGQQSRLMLYCVAVSSGLLCTYMGQIPGLLPWVFMVVVFALHLLGGQSQQQPTIRSPIPRRVVHSCDIFDSARRNARKVGRLHAGDLVDASPMAHHLR